MPAISRVLPLSLNLPILGALALSVAACDRPSADPAQPQEEAAAPQDEQLSGTLDRSFAGEAMPVAQLTDPDGKTLALAETKGTPVLLNLWATWCGPCVKELPTLDALARREGGKLHVVALSQNMDPAKVAPFMAQHGIGTLRPFTDAKMAWLPAVTANLPTTLLFDSAGKEVWRTTGDLDWTGAAAAKALAEVQ